MTARRRRPTIAISAARGSLDSDAGATLAHWVSDALLRAVIAAGGVPIIAAVGLPDHASTSVVAGADALVLTGGEDIGAYGSPYRVGRTDPERDRSEYDLLRAARDRQVPVLGICRGMQLLAVTSGGQLEPVDGHCGDPHSPLRRHQILVAEDSRLGTALGCALQVSSLHNFAVRSTGEFSAVAWADDGTVEAIEHPTGWELGVQWHPELSPTHGTTPLWEAFIDTAMRHRVASRRSSSRTVVGV